MPPSLPGPPPDPHQVLKELFGFDCFRPHQQEIVTAILDGRDAFVVMPTGGGKSLCYQLPARIMAGTCVVISPLISLMKDQVDAANATGLRAAVLNSSLDGAQRRTATRRLLNGELDLIYVAPERFAVPGFVEALSRIRLASIAIDEAHCISEWGHDFRPDYLDLGKLVERFPQVPLTAFTATATQRVQQDIVAKLGLRAPHTVRASFNRPNLFYKVIPKHDPGKQLLQLVREQAGQPGIVYRTTRKAVESTAEVLTANGIKALPYHAGLDDGVREANQDAFNRDQADVIVATIAFGMGIDKSNVRFVLHGDLPKNVESYYQETGRAGRDDEPARCLLLFGYGDIPKLRFFMDRMEDESERRQATRRLTEMIRYASVYACRRKQLLAYFGEHYLEQNCAACDVCTGEVEEVDASTDAQIVLSAMARTGRRFGINHIVDVVSGADTQRIRQLGHDRLKTYGAGRDKQKRHWRYIIDNLLAQEIVEQTGEDYPVLGMLPSAREVLRGEREVRVMVQQKPVKKTAAAKGELPHDVGLFEQLRSLRKELARQQGVPPYVVFSDRSLREMAASMPTNESEMAGINGVGEVKLARYGEAFMEIIRQYTAEKSAGST